MDQIEVMSWKTLDAIKQSATQIEEVIGDLDTHEQMAVFCSIEEDNLELYYSELEGNYIRHFEDEEEMLTYLQQRKSEFGEDFDAEDYYEDDVEYGTKAGAEDYTGFKVGEPEEEDDF